MAELSIYILLNGRDSLVRSKCLRFTKIVYYARKEEKTWTVHSWCKLPPEPKARVANTSCRLANFIPVVRILFFTIPGPKTPNSHFRAGRECGTFGQGVAKMAFSPCPGRKYHFRSRLRNANVVFSAWV